MLQKITLQIVDVLCSSFYLNTDLATSVSLNSLITKPSFCFSAWNGRECIQNYFFLMLEKYKSYFFMLRHNFFFFLYLEPIFRLLFTNFPISQIIEYSVLFELNYLKAFFYERRIYCNKSNSISTFLML